MSMIYVGLAAGRRGRCLVISGVGCPISDSLVERWMEASGSSDIALALPGLVLLAGLAQLIQGVQCLHEPVADVYDSGGVDELRAAKACVTEDVTHEVLARLQLLEPRGNHAVYNCPVLNRDQWLP